MLSWVLQYLGCPEVLLMDTFFEGWAKAGGEVFYRPCPTHPRRILTHHQRIDQGSVGGCLTGFQHLAHRL